MAGAVEEAGAHGVQGHFSTLLVAHVQHGAEVGEQVATSIKEAGVAKSFQPISIGRSSHRVVALRSVKSLRAFSSAPSAPMMSVNTRAAPGCDYFPDIS